MKRFPYRACILWILLVTIPLQGLAAAVGGCCLRVPAQSIASVPGNSVTEGASTMPCDDQASMQMTADGAADKGSQQHSSKAGSCKPCAACSIGASAPPSVFFLKIKSEKSDSPVVTPPSLFASHISAGLERPPKLPSLLS